MPATRPALGHVLGVTMTLAAAACSSGSSASITPTVAGTSQTPATQQPGSSSVATTAPTIGLGTGTAQVDLQFTGTRAITAKGTAGRCIIVHVGDRTSFGFEATEADYPGLGISYSMANLNADYVDIKWVIDADMAYGNPGTGGGSLSADHHSVTIDVDLQPFSSAAGNAPGPEHITGTITCP